MVSRPSRGSGSPDAQSPTWPASVRSGHSVKNPSTAFIFSFRHDALMSLLTIAALPHFFLLFNLAFKIYLFCVFSAVAVYF